MAAIAPDLPVLAREQAFEALYRRYVKDVYQYALALLRNPADAEDVTQTTFMNAYRAYKRGEVIQKPQNWLIKIAHNVARTRYARASRRVKEVPLEDHVDQLALPEEERPDVEGVLRALGRLPFNQRAALVMRELEGRTYAEIADTIGVSVPAVETLIFRARRSLRLRASALRALAAVPLPGSLAGLFEGGTVVAGGGALAGSGFVVKAAIALMAGAVATGIGGGQRDAATAAPAPAAATLAAGAPTSTVVAAVTAGSAGARQGRAPAGRAPSAKGTRPAAALVSGSKHSSGLTMGASKEAPSGTSTAGGSSTPLSTVTQAAEPVTNVVDTVEETVAAAVPPLPVSLPPVPPPPVAPPPPPPLP
jgi:RNA polymerase sigma factor (sigma-70 family)